MQTDERARTNTATILQGVAKTGLEPISAALSRDVSTISRMKEGDIPKFSLLLAVCGLKVVPEENKCVSPERMRAIKTLAQAALNSPGSDDLIWDE